MPPSKPSSQLRVGDVTSVHPLSYPCPKSFTQILSEKIAEHRASVSNCQQSYIERKEEIKRSVWEANSRNNVLKEDKSRLQCEKESVSQSETKQIKEVKSKRERIRQTCAEINEDRLLELVHVRMVRELYKDYEEELKKFKKDKG